MVRGSAVRVTGLSSHGAVPSTPSYAVSRCVASVKINEVTESGSNELIKDRWDSNRLHFVSPDKIIKYAVDLSFLRVDPGMLSLVSGVPVVTNAEGDIVGFDANTRLPAASFGLEVWSKITGRCATPQYGYTLFPFLKGGYLTGFEFANGLVSFNLVGAQTKRNPGWGSGPYAITADGGLLPGAPISKGKAWRVLVVDAPPPEQTCGVVTEDPNVIDGGTAYYSSARAIDGGSSSVTSASVIDGGAATG